MKKLSLSHQGFSKKLLEIKQKMLEELWEKQNENQSKEEKTSDLEGR